MMYRRPTIQLRYIVLCLLFLLPFSLRAHSQTRSIEQRFQAFLRVERSTVDLFAVKRAAVIGKSYNDLFVDQETPLASVHNADLRLLFRAANLATFFTSKSEFRNDMSAVLKELQRRGLATKDEYIEMYGALLAARKFTAARLFRVRHSLSEESPLPKYREAPNLSDNVPTELVISPDSRMLVRKRVNMLTNQIVIVSDPRCHFSRYGLADIESDPALAKVFKRYAIWLIPPERTLNFSFLQRWNKDHPAAPFVLAYSHAEWPMFFSWRLPTFYFFKNGTLVTSVVGWPKGGHKNEIKAALRKIDLLPLQ